QVQAPRAPAGGEQEIAQAVHDLGIDLRGVVRGQVFQDRVDAVLRNQGRVGEGVPQLDVVADGVAVVRQEADVVAEHAVAQPETGRGELVGDPRVDVRRIAAVRRQRVRAEQGGDPLLVRDDLDLGADEQAGRLVNVFVGGSRGGRLDLGRQAVVLAHE